MNASLWTVLAGAGIIVAGYLLAMRVLYRQSKEVDGKIDFSKVKPLKDDDRDD